MEAAKTVAAFSRPPLPSSKEVTAAEARAAGLCGRGGGLVLVLRGRRSVGVVRAAVGGVGGVAGLRASKVGGRTRSPGRQRR